MGLDRVEHGQTKIGWFQNMCFSGSQEIDSQEGIRRESQQRKERMTEREKKD